MNIIDIIEKKKNNITLNEEEIAFFIDGICDGSIKDYQASALLMAICINGMSEEETAILTDKMAHSGDTLDLSALSPTADKHSTGGVGDKTSLIVAPIVASLGMNIAKMSGRGLGHTGGTIDKLESIPGFRTELSEKEFFKQVEEIGISIISQSKNLVPADKILYALRDVTGTINSIPLIASSIMSKKLAAGADIIELDVKTGSGAFMKTEKEATALAEEMVKIGKANGKKVSALVTDMDTPLGTHIGNSLEIKEVISVLGNESDGDLRQLCLELASGIVSSAENIKKSDAYKLCIEALESGKALGKFKQMVSSQGGDVSFIENPEKFENASIKFEIKAEKEGFIHSMDAEKIGKSAAILGAGRLKKEDGIDFSAGIILCRKTGDKVALGDTLATLLTNKEDSLSEAENLFKEALEISSEKPPERVLLKGEIR